MEESPPSPPVSTLGIYALTGGVGLRQEIKPGHVNQPLWRHAVTKTLAQSAIFQRSKDAKRRTVYTLSPDAAAEPPRKRARQGDAKAARAALDKVRAFGQLSGR